MTLAGCAPAAGEHREVRKPDFFIVGAPKCGTTAFYTYLRNHPEVFMSPLKEPQFFAEEIVDDYRRVRTSSGYASLFVGATNEKRVGEASTRYLSSPGAPGRIRSFNAGARIIIMLRNPLDMMYSLHSEALYDGFETITSFEAALEEDEREKRGGPCLPGRRVVVGYREVAAFSAHVRRYLEAFGREKVHIVIYDDFKADPLSVFRDTLRFLDVCPDFRLDLSVINANRRARSKAVQRFLRRPPTLMRTVARAVLPLRGRKLAGDCIRWLNEAVKPRPPMHPGLRSRLQREFEPEVHELSRLLNRDLSLWAGVKCDEAL